MNRPVEYEMHRRVEYRLIMAGVCVLCAVGAVSAVVPAVEHALTVVLAVAAAVAVVALCVAAVRRELRIRRRLAAIQPLDPAQSRVHGHGPVAGSGSITRAGGFS
jgi:hypothetical protein